jgi:pyrroline-5-carboxylate reductase
MNNLEIAFVGAGNMATALILGMIAQGHNTASITACDPSAEQLQRLKSQLPAQANIVLSQDNAAISGAKAVVLAVKPQVMSEVAESLRDHLSPGTLVISIAAGVPISALQKWLGEQPIVRCMPNIPALVQLGASGLYANESVTDEQREAAESILGAVGMSFWLGREKDIDAVTAVSGSGPAYFFLFMEAMVEAGEELGLSADVASQLAIQTCAGAAKLATDAPDSLAELRKKVTSPGGTTERAMDSFRHDDFNSVVKRALHAAAARAAELESTMDKN